MSARTDRVLTHAREASPDSAGSTATRLSQRVRANPLPIAVLAAVVVGFLAGRLATPGARKSRGEHGRVHVKVHVR